MTYHISTINKGILGEWSKVIEELEELLDSREQNCKIMELLELSDLYGAINSYCHKYIGLSFAKTYKSMNKKTMVFSISKPNIKDIKNEVLEFEHKKTINTQKEQIALIYDIISEYLDFNYMLNMKDLKIMSRITARAFTSGERT